MVGLVLVSHSRRLAEAASVLAKGVGREELPVEFAGGAGDDHAELGTDATDIMDAVVRANRGDGVLVLMDLGSAVLSARLAQQMLEGDVAGVRLCPAPLVEGAVAAAVQIAAGADLDAVYREAANALAAKQAEFAPDDRPAPDAPAEGLPPDALLYRFAIDDPNGMHARPAAELVKALAGFDAEARIRNPLSGGGYANARSLNGIALSGIRGGDVAEVALWGPDRDAALAAVKKLVRETYHGREAAELPVPAVAAWTDEQPDTLRALSPGVAIGRLVVEDGDDEPLPEQPADDPEAEVQRFRAAAQAVRAALERRRDDPAATEEEKAILEAQAILLDDAETADAIAARIREKRIAAAGACRAVMRELADRYRAQPDAYMRERAADIAGLARLLADELAGGSGDAAAGDDAIILWADEISPARLSRWPRERLRGILARRGGVTSHAAILARARNIPAVAGYSPPAGADGAALAMDAGRLEIVVNPGPEQAAEFAARREAWLADQARELEDSRGEAATADGVRVEVWANVGSADDVEAARRWHAGGIGLLRTEFLFLDRRTPPDEEEQTARLAELLRPFADRPATVRVLDAGGDKDIPWLDLPREANPFLGVRGVRLLLAYPELFKTQLRAILRAGGAAGATDLRVMVPMVATADEVERSRALLEEAHAELAGKSLAHAWPVRFGIMVETPAAVLSADELAAAVDFFSIGTNDLIQYVMCAERGAARLAGLANGDQPAVLAAIRLAAEAAGRHGIEVAVCGEMGGDPGMTETLLRLGVRALSLTPSAVGRVKRAVRAARAGG